MATTSTSADRRVTPPLRYVADVMSAPVITVSPATPYKQMVRLLDEHAISALPVLDEGGRLVGIVSEADLLLKQSPAGRFHPFWEDPSHQRSLAAKAAASCAADVMTTRLVTVQGDLPIARAARLIRLHSVKRLPVVDADGKLVGIVSRADLLKPYLRADEDIRGQIVDTVLPRWLSIDPGRITVTVDDGAVRLEGTVERRSECEMITHFVSNLVGVVSVDNRIDYNFDDLRLKGRQTEARVGR